MPKSAIASGENESAPFLSSLARKFGRWRIAIALTVGINSFVAGLATGDITDPFERQTAIYSA